MTKTVTVDPEVAEKDTNGDGHISKQEMEMDLEFTIPFEVTGLEY